MHKEYITILQCPITGNDLRESTADELDQINQRILQKEIFHLDGTPVNKIIQQALFTMDKKILYPVVDGINILLKNLAIICDNTVLDKISKEKLKVEKKIVQDYYEQLGWTKNENNHFMDTAIFLDQREVFAEYIHRGRLRTARYFRPQGKYLLDAASGPVQYPEYVDYSKNYDFRICIDFSFLALKEAQKKLGNKGIFLLADVTNLLLKDNMYLSLLNLTGTLAYAG